MIVVLLTLLTDEVEKILLHFSSILNVETRFSRAPRAR
jgi:hypothetical protein